MVLRAEDNPFPSVLFAEHVDPATPPADHGRLFLDTDGILKWISDAGVVSNIALGSPLTDPMTTRGDIIYRNSSNVTARLARGSASQVLTSDGTDIAWATPSAGGAMATDALWDAAGDLAVGTGANTGAKLAIGSTGNVLGVASGTPAWQGGGLVLLGTQTPSAAASAAFTAGITATYDSYLFDILNLVPATANVDLFVRLGVSGSYDSGSNYSNTTFAQSVAAGNVSSGAAGTTAMKLRNAAEIDSNTSGGVTGTLRLWYPQSTTTFRRMLLDCSYLDGDPKQAKTWCEYTGNGGTAIDSVQFLFSSGNITSGTIRMYGITK